MNIDQLSYFLGAGAGFLACCCLVVPFIWRKAYDEGRQVGLLWGRAQSAIKRQRDAEKQADEKIASFSYPGSKGS